MQYDGPDNADTTIILAHGAGAGMDSAPMQAFADGLAASGMRVARFEFPYMQRRRETGKRGGPDRPPVLIESWHRAIEEAGGRKVIGDGMATGGRKVIGDGMVTGGRKVVVGGKSMGGRIASMIADEAGADGLVCLGYPFHPPGKPEKLRTAHLADLRTPTLIVQGTRDPFGKPEEVAGYELSASIRLHWLEDGDHSFKPRKSSGRTLEQNFDEAIAAISDFVERLE